MSAACGLISNEVSIPTSGSLWDVLVRVRGSRDSCSGSGGRISAAHGGGAIALFRKNLELRGTAITENQFRGISGLEEWRGRRDGVRRIPIRLGSTRCPRELL